MKTLFGAMILSSVVGFSAAFSAYAASPVELLSVSLQSSSAVQPAIARNSVDAATSSGAPVSLLAPGVMCGISEPAKVCAVRRAAERRAHEVAAAAIPRRNALPMALLIPAGLTPVRAVACDPQMTVEERDRLTRRGPGVPSAPVPPVVTVPQAQTPPIVADPESVIRPPPTGDTELVKKPPQTDSQMPVIKPRANPPVIQ